MVPVEGLFRLAAEEEEHGRGIHPGLAAAPAGALEQRLFDGRRGVLFGEVEGPGPSVVFEEAGDDRLLEIVLVAGELGGARANFGCAVLARAFDGCYRARGSERVERFDIAPVAGIVQVLDEDRLDLSDFAGVELPESVEIVTD